jgi:CRP-like cAMP-binding protein
LLRSIPIFAPLPEAVLEQLARDGRVIKMSAGNRIISAGESGDDFYVIVQGEAEVEASGKPSRLLHEGDSFGEIALLRDVPRTATVTATSNGELLALGRDSFLSAVTGNPDSAAAAHAVAAARLGSLRPEIASA